VGIPAFTFALKSISSLTLVILKALSIGNLTKKIKSTKAIKIDMAIKNAIEFDCNRGNLGNSNENLKFLSNLLHNKKVILKTQNAVHQNNKCLPPEV
jgi:hypothetical protein